MEFLNKRVEQRVRSERATCKRGCGRGLPLCQVSRPGSRLLARSAVLSLEVSVWQLRSQFSTKKNKIKDKKTVKQCKKCAKAELNPA